MNFEIHPIAFTYPDWTEYIRLCQENMGFSPTRGLDVDGLDPKMPNAFLATLDLKNQPLKSLREGYVTNPAFRHVSFTFLCIVDKDVMQFFQPLGLEVMHYEKNRRNMLIVSGTMEQWSIAMLRACSPEADLEIRHIFNSIFDSFKLMGFRDIWYGCQERDNFDRTFTLCT